MITPLDIENKTFSKQVVSGYNVDEVKQFMATLLTDYEKLYKENIEYKDKIEVLNQGIQHYKPVKQWGGENQLKKQQEHDKHKLELCRQLDIKLIIISYDEPLSEELILKKINDSTGTTT